MKISLIVITKDRSKKLARLVESIREGSRVPDEVIIVDNNSSDNTKDVVSSFEYSSLNIKYLFEPNKGISLARNRGLREALYGIVAFTDDDCIVHRDWVRYLIQGHEYHKEVVVVGGNTLNYYNGIVGYAGHLYRKYVTVCDIIFDGPKEWRNIDELLAQKHLMTSLATQNVSFKKDQISNMLFNVNLFASEAVDFSWRIISNNSKSILYFPKAIVYHEYRRGLLSFLWQHYEYGRSSLLLCEIATERGDCHRMKSFAPFSDFLKYSFYESKESSFNIFSKIFLFSILMLSAIAFNLPKYKLVRQKRRS